MIFKARMLFLFLFIYSVLHNIAVQLFDYCIKRDSLLTEQKIQDIQSKHNLHKNNSKVSRLSDLFMHYNHVTEKDTQIDESYEIQTNVAKMCPFPTNLGLVPVNKTYTDLKFVEQHYPEVQLGGHYAPPNCTARHKVAVIVPYKDRQQHLPIFLNHMHPFLMKQLIEYRIFIIEQDGMNDFNRAKLMNVGFAESQKQKDGGWQCFIFHDIDLLPLDSRNLYSCPKQPRHMSAFIDTLNCKLKTYEHLIGGVSAMTLEQFTKVNGFSNKYWGWGGEDDDMYYRLKKANYHIARYKTSIARYTMLDHMENAPNPTRYQLLFESNTTFKEDGLSTLEYELLRVTQRRLFTHIVANIDEPDTEHTNRFTWPNVTATEL